MTRGAVSPRTVASLIPNVTGTSEGRYKESPVRLIRGKTDDWQLTRNSGLVVSFFIHICFSLYSADT